MCGKEHCLEGEKSLGKQQVMDKLFESLTKQSAASKVLKSGSKEWIAKQHLSFMRTAFPSMLLIHPVLHAQ